MLFTTHPCAAAGACALPAALLLALLSGCAGRADDHLPLAAGRWAVFAVTATVLDETVESRYLSLDIGPAAFAGEDLFVRRTQATTIEYLRVGSDGIERVAARTRGAAAAVVDQPPRLLVPAVPDAARAWTVPSTLGLIESRTFARGDRLIPRRYPVTITKHVAATDDTVSVPAGTFTRCLRIEGDGRTTVPTDRRNASAAVVVATREWYAPGVGLVRVERTESSTSSFLKTGTQQWVLLDHGH